MIVAIVDYGAGNLASVRRALAVCGATPVLASHASKEKSLDAAERALAKDLNPPADLYHSSATKLHLAKVLLSRAWNTLSKPR